MNEQNHPHARFLLILLACALLAGATNYFPGRAGHVLTGPAIGTFNPTQSDSVSETIVCRGFWVESGGDVSFLAVDGNEQTWTMAAGQQVNIQVIRFNDTGTTLSDGEINCLY